MACGKKVYLSKSDAKKGKKRLNKKYNKQLTNPYYCDECSNWHLTSMKKNSSRSLTRINKS